MKPGHITIRRLRRLVKILESIPEPDKIESDDTPRFSMYFYQHDCGTPACQAGWYFSRNARYTLTEFGLLERKTKGRYVLFDGALIEEFPDLTPLELYKLFGVGAYMRKELGVVGELTLAHVIEYDKRFIEQKLQEK